MTESARPMGKLTPHMLAQARVIAKGNRIRDVQRLVATYGGKHSTWVKKSSPPFAVGAHYYEYQLLLSLGKQYEQRGMRAQTGSLTAPSVMLATPFAHSSVPSRCSCGSHRT